MLKNYQVATGQEKVASTYDGRHTGKNKIRSQFVDFMITYVLYVVRIEQKLVPHFQYVLLLSCICCYCICIEASKDLQCCDYIIFLSLFVGWGVHYFCKCIDFGVLMLTTNEGWIIHLGFYHVNIKEVCLNLQDTGSDGVSSLEYYKKCSVHERFSEGEPILVPVYLPQFNIFQRSPKKKCNVHRRGL